MWEIFNAKLKPVVKNKHQVMKLVVGLMKALVPEKRANSLLDKILKSKPGIKHVSMVVLHTLFFPISSM